MKICDSCFHDVEIRSYIRSNSTQTGICECCSTHGHLLDITELLDFFIAFLSIFKFEQQGNRIEELIQRDWNLFQSEEVCFKILSESILKVELALTLGIAKDMLSGGVEVKVKYLDEIEECVSYWDKLKNELKWKRRYLTNIDEMLEFGWGEFFNYSFNFDPKTIIYRARINSESQTEPYLPKDMLSPPVKNTSSGRVNPVGIPLLYLSKEINTTLYEIRAALLDNISVGHFKIKQGCEINIVDFTSIQSVFNNTDEMFSFVKKELLRRAISVDLSKPLRRYDSELEYIPTQFICEFIRYITKADGIQFNSSLKKDGLNIVLFNQDNIICTKVELYQINNIDIESVKLK